MSAFNKLPIINQIWSKIREHKILKKHTKVAAYWKPVIDLYFSGKLNHYNISSKKKLPLNRVIWQYWGQGLNDEVLPEVVKLCFESVDKYKGDYVVVRLHDGNINEYLDLPDFVLEKLKNKIFTKTFFSDLLRVALLNVYGGVWLDATVLMTGPFEKKYTEMDYFLYQRDPLTVNKKSWENSYAFYWNWHDDFKVKMLSSIFYAHKRDLVTSCLFDLMLYYWQTKDYLDDYFVFQVLYQELVDYKLKNDRCVVVNDTYPHLLQTKFNGGLNDMSYEQVLNLTNTHKMSYFKEEGLQRLKAFLVNCNQ